MRTKDFFYDLPNELIAQKPLAQRDDSRLMVVNRDDESLTNLIFKDLPSLITEKYIMVFNQTRVFSAKIMTLVDEKECEMLLLKEIEENLWKCMVKPGKKFKIGKRFILRGKITDIDGQVDEINEDGTRNIRLFCEDSFAKWVEINGYTPLPPYIKNENAKLAEYQTVYARSTGSIAAPTAGLHFTDDILAQLDSKGVEKAFVTLHVGRGTFLPVKAENIEDHKMHSEEYEIDKNTANVLNKAKSAGKKILAVGTTSVRTLESNFKDGKFTAEKKETDIFIYPGYSFKAVDGILTNFHLPQSTLLMLISAFASKNLIFDAYKKAVEEKYRFFSFGDAMLIL